MSALPSLLREARAALDRVEPEEAAREAATGAMLVDIRPESHRRDEGAIPGALVIERNVLEWRLDPEGEYRIPELAGPNHRVIVVCDEGYASSLAAATLQSIGLVRATDLVGGFRAWLAAGLPVERLNAGGG